MPKLPKFIPSVELNRKFYEEVIGPLIKAEFPQLKYAAALVGNGSDVLGFDDPTSMDHNWGPQMRIILPEANFKTNKDKLDKIFRQKLPYDFLGFPTNFTKESKGYLKQQMKPVRTGPVNHLIQFYTSRSFFRYYLGFDPKQKPSIEDWLTFPEQALLEVSGGHVFHDTVGFKAVQKRFTYFPQDVWFYILWVQWGRMTNELAYQARTGINGDIIGSRLIANRMVRRMVKMAFMLEGQYAPYTKWFGAAFKRLRFAHLLEPLLIKILDTKDWQTRQKYITEAHKTLGQIHNKLKITKPLPIRIFDFHGRGYKVFDMEPFIFELKRRIKNKKLKNLKYELGALDQFIDHSRINHENYVYRKLKYIIK